MIETLIVFNVILCIGIYVVFEKKFRKSAKIADVENLVSGIKSLKNRIELLAEKKYIEDTFVTQEAQINIQEGINHQIEGIKNEMQNLMEEQTELNKTLESKLSIDDADENFVSKDFADQNLASKEDLEKLESEISKQLEIVKDGLINIQEKFETLRSNILPEAVTNILNKGKAFFETLSAEMQDQYSKLDQKMDLITQPSAESQKENNLDDEKMIKSDNYEVFENQLKSKQITLLNGKVNQEYYSPFDINSLGINEVGDFEFVGLDELGLSYDKDEKGIKGVPVLAGDHKINIEIKRNDWTDGKPIFHRAISLIVNHDPKSLWNNIPTPMDIEYYKPDEDKLFVKVESLNGEPRKDIVAASQRGRSHAHEGKPRDDDFKLYYDDKTDWYVLSVADGAGSAKSSRKGSEIATQTVIDVCREQLSIKSEDLNKLISDFNTDKSVDNRKKLGDSMYTIIGNAVFKAYKAICEEAQNTNKPVKDFSTTLVLSICKKFSFGWFVGAFWVGDGGVGIYNKETVFLKILGETDGGEFAGQTRFLTMPEITQPAELYRRLRFDIVEDFTAVILMTDGISDPKFETDANLLKIEKWNELWEDLAKEVDFTDDNEAASDQLLKWLDFWSPGNHDDRTIAILY